MEPRRQVEIQLGHSCTNRCVFCVSGQRAEEGTAKPLEAAPILSRITEAREAGHRKITLLGGEPTIQPSFLEVVRHCVAAGFDEIVIFTNGARTEKEPFLDEVLATGGNFAWRVSVQGGDEASHERTTRRKGSFARLVRSLENLAARGQRVTANTCLVSTNFESVHLMPALLLPFGVSQLHLDMMRPKDAGRRDVAELRALIPRYSDMVPSLERMVKGFEEASPGFDVNIGNLPQCLAPSLARWIRHDGQMTETVAIDGDDSLSRPWNKYEVKARDKIKPAGCLRCAFNARCSGVYETYAALRGLDDFAPMDHARLEAIDPRRHLLPLHLAPLREAVETAEWPSPFTGVDWSETGDNEVTITLAGPSPLVVTLRPPSHVGAAACEAFSLHLRRAPQDPRLAGRALQHIWGICSKPYRRAHPLGADALIAPGARMARILARLRAAAPFDPLEWREVIVGKDKLELLFGGPDGELIRFWFGEGGGAPTGGYRLERGEASPAVVAGIRAVMSAVSVGGSAKT